VTAYLTLGSVAAMLAALVCAPSRVAAQRLLLDETRITLAPAFQSIRFGQALAQDSLRVTGLTQFSTQFSASVPITSAWKLDVTVGYGTSAVTAADSARVSRNQSLSGLTDTRLRISGQPFGEAMTIVVGVNAPTGRTKLTSEDVAALRVVGAPVFRLAVPTLGVGPGGSAGIVYAFRAAGWAIGAGAGYEMRGKYSPIDAVIFNVPTSSTLDPGDLIRLSLGGDRVIGQNRLSMIVAAEIFSSDQTRAAASGRPDVASSFTLGPSISATAQLAVAAKGFQRMTAFGSARYRSAFQDGTGATVAGSSGTQLDVGIEAVKGGTTGIALIGSLVGRVDSGLSVDESITTAGIAGGTAMLGVVIPAGHVSVQPFIQGSVSSLRTGAVSTSANGFGAGITMTVRR